MGTQFLSKSEQQEVLKAIENAESNTSGEIRIHIESHCKGDILDRAADIFEKLKMHKTELRNGVLIYLATKDKKFAIIGDAGINAVVPKGFWDETKDAMAAKFKEFKFAEGLTLGIAMVGTNLKKFFPIQAGDVNELTNEISFGQ
jgi:uncharacterized membrane protein